VRASSERETYSFGLRWARLSGDSRTVGVLAKHRFPLRGLLATEVNVSKGIVSATAGLLAVNVEGSRMQEICTSGLMRGRWSARILTADLGLLNRHTA